jgi:general secretion pathway protein C
MTISPRHLVAINLALLAAIAYVSSSVVATAIAARLTPPPVVRISDPPPPLAAEPRQPNSYYALIGKRDIFNSAKPEAPKPVGPPPKTELRVRLWGVAIDSGGKSSCVIEDLGTRKQDLYKVGDLVQGTATVARVEWDKVILTRDGQEEVLELSPDLRRPPGLSSSSPTGGTPVAPTADERIQLTGDDEYLIDRTEVESALDNMSQLFTQVRAVPHFEGGRSTGFRLFAIRQDSLFDRIGLKNGDIIQKINGVELTDPSRAMALFQELRNEREISVEVLRNKEPRTLSYQFR